MPGFNVSGYAGPLLNVTIAPHEGLYALLIEFADSTVHVPGLLGEDVRRISKACENALNPPVPEARLDAYAAHDRNA